MRKLFFLLMLIAFPLMGQGDFSLPFQSFELKNGLQVILLSRPESSLVSVQLFYRVGSADEEAKTLGISHFLEHMMFKTSENLKAGEYSETIKSRGGYDNAATTFDYTTYYLVLPAAEIETGLKLEAERMARLTFDEKEVESERGVIIEERHNRYENSPFGFLWEKANEVFFKGMPYGNPIIGYESTLNAIGSKELKAFYRRYYSSSNAILIVAGNFESDQTRALIEQHFGSITPFKTPDRKKAESKAPLSAGKEFVFEKEIQSPYGMLLFTMPPAHHALSSAFLVLDSILFQGQNSLLNRKLVLEDRICFNVGGGGYLRRQDSSYMVYFIPAPEKSSKEIAVAVMRELEALKTRKDLPALMEKARRFILTEYYQDLQKVDGLSRTLGWGYIMGSPDFGLKLYEKVRDLTETELLMAADYLLKQAPAVFSLNPVKK